MRMLEVREAPVPVLGRFWLNNEPRDEFIENLRFFGWSTCASEVAHDLSVIIDPIGYVLSNGQTVIVRAKP